MRRVFDDSFKKMAVELSYIKESVLEAAKELDMDAGRLSKWCMDPRYNGGTLLPKNDKISAEEQELREPKKRLKEAELENAILKKAVAIFSKGDT
jgi:transposase